jgi:hypothetical protein
MMGWRAVARVVTQPETAPKAASFAFGATLTQLEPAATIGTYLLSTMAMLLP